MASHDTQQDIDFVAEASLRDLGFYFGLFSFRRVLGSGRRDPTVMTNPPGYGNLRPGGTYFLFVIPAIFRRESKFQVLSGGLTRQ
jgi:hypothetical protein